MDKKLEKQLKKLIHDDYDIKDIEHNPFNPVNTKRGKCFELKIFVEEKRPKWIRIVRECWDVTVNNVYEVAEWNSSSVIIKDDKGHLHEFTSTIWQPATKAEIEAHKLGFHVGDEVFYEKSRVKIEGFQIIKPDEHEVLRAMVSRNVYTEGSDDIYLQKLKIPIFNLTKTKPVPNLFLGDQEVGIATIGAYTYIKCVYFNISKIAWIQWYNKLTLVWPSVEYCEMSISDLLIKLYKQENYISIGTIDKITYEQVQAVTERLRETT